MRGVSCAFIVVGFTAVVLAIVAVSAVNYVERMLP